MSIKQIVRQCFPKSFSLARRVKGQITIEVQVIRQVGVGVLLDRFSRKPANWKQELPLQKILRFDLRDAPFFKPSDLITWLVSHGLQFSEGGHTIYLPPATVSLTPFAALLEKYPPDSGLKIMKNTGEAKISEYVNGSGHSFIHRRITHTHPHLLLVANVLNLENIGPRLYDLLELDVGRCIWTAYVVKHCDGRLASVAECEAAMEHFRSLDNRGVMKITAPEGFAHSDFTCPACNGNALVSSRTSQFCYFDFQNFRLENYGEYIIALANQAATESHFGQKSILRGGRYLYQSVPGAELPAKRDIKRRAIAIESLLQQGGCELAGRLVLDVGCNIGMMLGQYLRMGAAWAHGWDFEAVTKHTERLLLALGCTRFSLTSGPIVQAQALTTDVPKHARYLLDGCVISYLAIRGHVGWLEELGKLKWSFMVYEGHEGESEADFDAHFAALSKLCHCEIVERTTYQDGDCIDRPLALVRRIHLNSK